MYVYRATNDEDRALLSRSLVNQFPPPSNLRLKNGDGNSIKLAYTETQFDDFQIAAGVRAWYAITSTDGEGNESLITSLVDARIKLPSELELEESRRNAAMWLLNPEHRI